MSVLVGFDVIIHCAKRGNIRTGHETHAALPPVRARTDAYLGTTGIIAALRQAARVPAVFHASHRSCDDRMSDDRALGSGQHHAVEVAVTWHRHDVPHPCEGNVRRDASLQERGEVVVKQG